MSILITMLQVNKVIILLLIPLLFLLLASPAQAIIMVGFGGGCSGNNFSGDANCKALYRFESGALGTDSKGNNTLSLANTPVANTTDYREGTSSVDLESSDQDFLYIHDSNLDSGFPLKYGDTNKKISITGWFKLESDTGAKEEIFVKFDGTNNKRSLRVYLSPSTLCFGIGYSNGTSYETICQTATVSIGVWYHFGFTFQDSDRSYRMYLWNASSNSLVENTTGNTTNNISITDAPVCIGALCEGTASPPTPFQFFDGLIDEVVIFNDILSTSEIDQIRNGCYAP